MFECRVCEEKDRRIHDLMDQVLMLRSFVQPPQDAHKLTLLAREADHILSGSDEMLREDTGPTDAESEATRLLSGTYDL